MTISKMTKNQQPNSDTINRVIFKLGISNLVTLKKAIDEIIIEKRKNKYVTLDKLNKLQKVIKTTGLTSTEIVEMLEGKPKRKFKRPAKFIFPDAHGNPKSWAGVGKCPTELQKLLDEGNDIEQYKVLPD